ncbi:MAG: selenium-binding family protein [Gemmataceae bacterium]|nr:selenium-binding family protein [Gemmataceae bacterium]
MDRRQFLQAGAAVVGTSGLRPPPARADDTPGFASPKEAMRGPREKLLFVACTYADTGVNKPDYLAVVDADPASKTYAKVVHRLRMPEVGDELHHFGWNNCSSCHGRPGDRRYLVVPGLGSGRIHIIDAKDPLNLKLHKVIPPEKVKAAGYTAPHTVHCLPSGEIMLSMLGDQNGDAPGGFLLLDDKFEPRGQWARDPRGMNFNYDFWYQPRWESMVSTEWAAPNTYRKGFDPKDVAAGKYGKKVHFWNWEDRRIEHSVELHTKGDIPLEVRFCHDPDRPDGFVGAALGSSVWYFKVHRDEKGYGAVLGLDIEVDPVKAGGQDVPGLITDILLSMDDRFLYLSNWLHGDVRQYDITDPEKPKLVGQLFLGGVIGKARELHGEKLLGGPQMLQLSLDGKRLYVTNSLLGRWYNQFYPGLAKRGSWMVELDCDTEKGGLALNDKFFVDFGKEPDGPSRAHEVRYPGGDCTSDIFS